MAMRKPPGLRGDWEPTYPVGLDLLTRPATPLPATRPPEARLQTLPHDGCQPSPSHQGFQPTRPMADWQPTRPADLPPPRAEARPARAPALALAPAPAPAPAPVMRRPPPTAISTPPSAEGHWQVAGTPGQNLVLMPGQMHLGQHVSSVRTLLGSCVAITLWHPARRIGGMCHFLLPSRARRAGEPTDGRYGDEAVEAMVLSLKALRTAPEDYVAHLYGGADTMSGVSAARFNIGERNIEQGWTLIDRYGFRLDGVDVGEDIPRMVSLSLTSGTVAMRRGTGSAPDHLRS